MPDGSGFYGSGYNQWGVQTNQKYAGALAVLAAHPASMADRGWARKRTLSALRFSLESHVTGEGRCTDGTQWGHTWISALGIERMMFGLHLLREHLVEQDKESLRRVLMSEADYLLNEYSRNGIAEVTGDLWNDSGRNVPESNIWNGALLWRTAVMFPDHAHAVQWRERAHCFLINGVSIPADAEDETVIAGKPVRERFAGANFFPSYALDHHGYLNVGYMLICTSNAALLHFDMKAQKLPRPETLDHHHRELWQVLRRMIFANGRLARIGGDSRVRYAYCQEYSLPALLYAADHLGENHAVELINAQLRIIEEEARHSGDGSFFSGRLQELKKNPYYFTRLESDRACCLAMLLAYAPLLEKRTEPQSSFEDSVTGSWCEPEHGAALHRCPTRFASFSWRSMGKTQGLCLPPDDGHFAEWQQNLCSVVSFLDEIGPREVLSHHIENFDGGFVTAGEVGEGMNVRLHEGWQGSDLARHQLAFAALPDGHTVVGLELCTVTGKQAYLSELKGLHLAFANDLFNSFHRRLVTELGEIELTAPAPIEEVVPLGSRWANVDERLGVLGIYGADELSLHRTPQRRGGRYQSLYTEEIGFPVCIGTRVVEPQEVLLDIGWMVCSGITAQQTRALDATPIVAGAVRAVALTGQDGRRYGVLANFGREPIEVGDIFASAACQKIVERGCARVVVLSE